MGADGYRGVTAHDFSLPLNGQEVFAAGEFHRADGNFVITDTSQSSFAGAHSDIQKPEVAAFIVAAARAAVLPATAGSRTAERPTSAALTDLRAAEAWPLLGGLRRGAGATSR